MNITLTFPDLERLIASLGLTITDAVAEAGCDAEKTLSQIREASRFAHVQARLLDRVSEALAGEVLVSDDDTDDQRELRAAVARRGNPPNVSALFPQVRVGGDGPEAA